jgi:hypothetical protein
MGSALNSVLGGGGAGGILGAALNIAGMVFPPLGIATSLANMVTQGVGQAVTGAAQQLIKDSGMPKFLGNVIGDIVKGALDQIKQPSSPSCDDRCGGDKGVQDFMKDMVQNMIKDLVDKTKDEMECQAKKGGGKKGGAGSWLEALSRAMGEVAGDKAAKMVELSNKITSLSGDDSPEAAKEMTATTQELNGTSKLFSMLQDAFNNVVKSIGDGLSTAARKQ